MRWRGGVLKSPDKERKKLLAKAGVVRDTAFIVRLDRKHAELCFLRDPS